MFNRLASLAAAAPRRLAGLGLLALIVLAVFGAPALGKLYAQDSFNDPGSQSSWAQTQIQNATGHDAYPKVLALVKAPPGSAAVAHAAAVLRADPAVAGVTVPPPGTGSPLVSRDGSQTLIPAVLRAGINQKTVVDRLTGDFRTDPQVALGGDAVTNRQTGQQAVKDLALAELIALPLLALLSVLIFRGIGAVLPLAVGAGAVLGTFAALRAINVVLPMSPFALDLVIGLGLGLAVDYSLLFASRFREELGHPGATRAGALAGTLNSAGRTVTFSAVTVALAAAAVTLVFLPPLLYLLAGRLGKVHPAPEGTGRWHALARAVMRRPAVTAAGATLLMLLIAAPAARIHWTSIDATVLPTSQSSRVVSVTFAADFPGAGTSPLTIAVTAPASAGPALDAYAAQLRGTSGVHGVTPPADLGHDTWQITVGVRGAPASTEAQALVVDVRAEPAPYPVAVGGQAASLADQHAAVARTLPVALALLAALTVLVLWLMTGSVTLPVMTLLTNALTLAAATGIVVFAFQDGHLASLFGTTPLPGIEQTSYLVLAAIVFGLSTDYGVFLLTRIKEARQGGRSDSDAIALGIQRTGAIVSAAALLLAVALGAFLTAKVVFLKELGLGAAAAVLIDAFIVRTLLAPATMGLLGGAAWWSPRPLRRLHQRIGISESQPQPHHPRTVPAGSHPTN